MMLIVPSNSPSPPLYVLSSQFSVPHRSGLGSADSYNPRLPRLAKETMRRVVLLAFAACAVSAGSPSGQTAAFAPNLSLRSTGTAASAASSFVGGRASAGLCSASLAPRQDSARASRLQSVTPVKMAGLYDDDDTPKATKELFQGRFAKIAPDALRTWINKWPSGGVKDKFGLPKLMLPVSTEPNDKGLKIIFKGSLDPWLQIELEGDTVRVYRCSGLSTTSLSVSALKEREEAKICDKLKEDLKLLGDMTEKEIPVVKAPEPEVEDEAEAEAEDKDAAGDAAAAGGDAAAPPA